MVLLVRLTTVLTAALSPGREAPLCGFAFALVIPILLTRAAAATRALLLREGRVALLLLDSRDFLGRRLPLVPRLFPRRN